MGLRTNIRSGTRIRRMRSSQGNGGRAGVVYISGRGPDDGTAVTPSPPQLKRKDTHSRRDSLETYEDRKRHNREEIEYSGVPSRTSPPDRNLPRTRTTVVTPGLVPLNKTLTSSSPPGHPKPGRTIVTQTRLQSHRFPESGKFYDNTVPTPVSVRGTPGVSP